MSPQEKAELDATYARIEREMEEFLSKQGQTSSPGSQKWDVSLTPEQLQQLKATLEAQVAGEKARTPRAKKPAAPSTAKRPIRAAAKKTTSPPATKKSSTTTRTAAPVAKGNVSPAPQSGATKKPGTRSSSANPVQQVLAAKKSQKKKQQPLSERLAERSAGAVAALRGYLLFEDTPIAESVAEAKRLLRRLPVFRPEEFFATKNIAALSILYQYSPADWGLARICVPRKVGLRSLTRTIVWYINQLELAHEAFKRLGITPQPHGDPADGRAVIFQPEDLQRLVELERREAEELFAEEDDAQECSAELCEAHETTSCEPEQHEPEPHDTAVATMPEESADAQSSPEATTDEQPSPDYEPVAEAEAEPDATQNV
ncbi:MAG: hypothetical protein KDA41_10685, partial [Planctomycetales bacterium]|nr:hypothetical protein [Planctomycetales bacterium]